MYTPPSGFFGSAATTLGGFCVGSHVGGDPDAFADVSHWPCAVLCRVRSGEERVLRDAISSRPTAHAAVCGGTARESKTDALRSFVRYKEKRQPLDYAPMEIPIQWDAWLRHTRRKAPSIQVRRASPPQNLANSSGTAG